MKSMSHRVYAFSNLKKWWKHFPEEAALGSVVDMGAQAACFVIWGIKEWWSIESYLFFLLCYEQGGDNWLCWNQKSIHCLVWGSWPFLFLFLWLWHFLYLFVLEHCAPPQHSNPGPCWLVTQTQALSLCGTQWWGLRLVSLLLLGTITVTVPAEGSAPVPVLVQFYIYRDIWEQISI